MKTIGIVMLFGLCCMIGIRLGMKKTARLHLLQSLRNDLARFSERIVTCSGTLTEIAEEGNGTLSRMLRIYLEMLCEGKKEADAAEYAAEALNGFGNVQNEVRSFLNGLSGAARDSLIKRTEALMPVLERAEAEAETEAKQARVLKISGVLTGAGLAILLL